MADDKNIIKPNPNQLNAIRSNCDMVVLSGGASGGKAQPYDAKVLTPNGWELMGNLKVGSLIMNPSGRAQKVIAIYEQGMKECVELTFSDGAKCECDLEHLWLAKVDSLNEDVYITNMLLPLFDAGMNISVPIYLKDYDSVNLVSYRYIGKKQCRCISVDNPNRLYITNDYLVTHNTFLECMYNSYDVISNPNFSATYLRKNIKDFSADGGIMDTMKKVYPLRDESAKNNKKYTVGKILTSDSNMGIYFDNGATLRFKHIADDREDKVVDSFKGIQTIKVIFDEADMFSAFCLFYPITRMRGTGVGKRQIIIAQNPERECPMRTFCGSGENGGGWIGDDGYPIDEMNGVVRYYNIKGGDLNTVCWGKTKKEVYEKCKDRIDEELKKTAKVGLKWDDYIFSCVFFTLSVLDNESVMKDNPNYVAGLSMAAGAGSMSDGNWNYSKKDPKAEESKEALLNYNNLSYMFKNKPNINSKLRIVVDPAGEGVDNFTMMAFQGFHCFDFWYEQKTPVQDAPQRIRDFMNKHGASNRDLIIDRIGFEWLMPLFPRAHFYRGGHKVSKKGNDFRRIRDEAAFMACQMIDRGLITFEPHLANVVYKHQRCVRRDTTLLLQMVEEAKCFIFGEDEYGKKKIMNKKDQAYVINGKSSDLTDLIVMLCGALIGDCYKELAGKPNTSIPIDMLNAISNNPERNQGMEREIKKSKNMANLLTKKFGW